MKVKKSSFISVFSICLAIILLAFSITACDNANNDTNDNNNTKPISTKTKKEEIPIKIDELNVHFDVVGTKAIFWFENNSNYTISGIKFNRVMQDTDEIISAVAGYDVAPGETSERGEFLKIVTDENGDSDWANVSGEELNNSINSSIEIDYLYEKDNNISNNKNNDTEEDIDEDDYEEAGVEYDYITKSYHRY